MGHGPAVRPDSNNNQWLNPQGQRQRTRRIVISSYLAIIGPQLDTIKSFVSPNRKRTLINQSEFRGDSGAAAPAL